MKRNQRTLHSHLNYRASTTINRDFRFESPIPSHGIGQTASQASFSPVLVQGAPSGAGKGSVSHLMGTQRPEMPFFPTVPQTLFPSPQRRHRNSLTSALALSCRRRQRRDLPQHAGKQPPRQVALRQQQPVANQLRKESPSRASPAAISA